MEGKLIGMLLAILLVLAAVVGLIGLVYNLLSKKRKWNWRASFLAPWYYAERGRWGLWLLFGFLYGSLIPVMMLAVAIYAGIRADRDLPAERSEKASLYITWVTLMVLLVAYAQMRNLF